MWFSGMWRAQPYAAPVSIDVLRVISNGMFQNCLAPEFSGSASSFCGVAKRKRLPMVLKVCLLLVVKWKSQRRRYT